MKRLLMIFLLALSGCTTCYSSKIPVPIKCQDKRLAPEVLPDTPEDISKVPNGDLEDLVKLVMKGRVIRDQRLAEDDAQIQACTK